MPGSTASERATLPGSRGYRPANREGRPDGAQRLEPPRLACGRPLAGCRRSPPCYQLAASRPSARRCRRDSGRDRPAGPRRRPGRPAFGEPRGTDEPRRLQQARARPAGPRPQRGGADGDPVARLEGHPVAHLRADQRGPAAGGRGRRGVLRPARAVSRPSPPSCRSTACSPSRRRSATTCRCSPACCRRAASTSSQEQITRHRRQGRRQARLRLPLRPGPRAVERQCRHEGDHRRAQRHLRRGREAQLRQAQPRSRSRSRFGAIVLRCSPRSARWWCSRWCCDCVGLGELTDTLIALCCAGRSCWLVVLFGLAVLYRFGPSRRAAQWQWLTPGSAVRRLRLARRLGAVLAVSVEFRRLRRDLRLARRRHRPDDVDVAVRRSSSWSAPSSTPRSSTRPPATPRTARGPSRSATAAPRWPTRWARRRRDHTSRPVAMNVMRAGLWPILCGRAWRKIPRR